MRDDDVLADQDASRPTSTIVFAILSALFGAWVSMDKYIEGPTSPETANLHLFMVIFMALGVPLFTELAALAFFSDRHQSGDQAKKDEAKR